METIYIIISLAFTVGASLGGIVVARRLAGGITKDSVLALRQEAQDLDVSLNEVLGRDQPFISKAQLTALANETEEFKRGLESQRSVMTELEARLATTQKQVEEKEREQQEMKASKEEDEKALLEITSKYHEHSTHAVALEHRLAESLKALDAMIAEVPMTADQKAVFQALSNALGMASSRLRDLIIDYQGLNERLENLSGQHADLENEYTKLVEQQLGA